MSRSTRQFLRELKQLKREIDVVSAGSSLKICRVAEGVADIYPRFGRTMEWDTAAAHAVLLHAGGNIKQTADEHSSLTYNKSSMENPSFIAYR
jgi:3'(2'), 5'-bisphosphate nucleotidase